jgi:serine protease Do
MSRPFSSALVLHVAWLAGGVVLGIALDRCGPFVAAQSGRTPPSAVLTPTSAVLQAQTKASSEEGLYQQLARQYERFEHVNRTFELVAKAVSPSVVHIVAQKTGRSEESLRIRHYEETGSGVIVRADRGKGLYVLTNNHVVEGASPSKISIFLHDGRSLHPDRVWLDGKADIAVLNLGRNDLPCSRLGNSDEAAVGSWVLAVGSPFGLTHSVSQGIISARGRHMEELPDVENQDFLQTDAAINPGNSGGPLVNMKGEVIGINNSIASNGGGNEGVGFSIPINLARWIMNQLIANGHVSRGALGIDLHRDFLAEDARAIGLDRPRGAWVELVHQASPAALGGIRDGDVILRFNGVEVIDLNHLINIVSMAPIGQPAEVVVWREGKEQRPLRVNVGNRDDRTFADLSPSPPAGRGSSPGLLRRPERPSSTSTYAMGLELVTLDEVAAQRLRLPGSLRGVAVARVAPGSPLDSIVQPLDVITAVDGRPVRTADEAVKALNRRTGSPALILEFDRMARETNTVERRKVQVP